MTLQMLQRSRFQPVFCSLRSEDGFVCSLTFTGVAILTCVTIECGFYYKNSKLCLFQCLSFSFKFSKKIFLILVEIFKTKGNCQTAVLWKEAGVFCWGRLVRPPCIAH